MFGLEAGMEPPNGVFVIAAGELERYLRQVPLLNVFSNIH